MQQQIYNYLFYKNKNMNKTLNQSNFEAVKFADVSFDCLAISIIAIVNCGPLQNEVAFLMI